MRITLLVAVVFYFTACWLHGSLNQSDSKWFFLAAGAVLALIGIGQALIRIGDAIEKSGGKTT